MPLNSASRLGPRSRRIIAVILVLFFAPAVRGQQVPIITTVAGGLPLDGLPATSNPLFLPLNVATDIFGNLFIADTFNNRICKVDTQGMMTTVAGNGAPGYSGDNGPATSAALNTPAAITLDAGGDLIIADTFNQVIRKVDSQGIITTIAGNGVSGFSGDNGPATSASLSFPDGVVTDHRGNLFIADTSNNRIRRVSARGIITTVTGNGVFGSFSGDNGPATAATVALPTGMAVDTSGNLFIADTDNNRIRKIDTNGIITTVAGNGTSNFSDNVPATTTGLCFTNLDPAGVAVDRAGNLFISESCSNRVRKVDTHGIITTVAGNGNFSFSGDGGPATAATLASPAGVTSDSSGNLYIVDGIRIRKVDSNGIITTVAGNGQASFFGDGGPAVNALLGPPFSGFLAVPAVDSHGNLFIADNSNDLIRKVDGKGIITTVAALHEPSAITVDSSGNLFVSAAVQVFKVDTAGTVTLVAGVNHSFHNAPVGDGGPATQAVIFPGNVALDGTGQLFIADRFPHHRIRKVDSQGIITTVIGNATGGFSGDGGLATAALVSTPAGVAFDAAGNLFIADTGNARIRKVDTRGIITTVAGNGTPGFSGDGGPATAASLSLPIAIAVDGAGNLFITEGVDVITPGPLNHRIRKVDALGIITTIAGNGIPAFSGDGGPAAKASLDVPAGTAVDNHGNLYIADMVNRRIRKVATSGFLMAASPVSNTIQAGQSANFTLTVTPYGFTGSISFACSGLPSHSSCSFNPASANTNGTPVSVTLTVHTAGPGASLRAPESPRGGGEIPRPALALCALGGPLGIWALLFAGNRRGERHGRWWLFALCGALLVVALIGCGGGSTNASLSPTPAPTPPPSPATSSAITVTATSADGSVVSATGIGLTVTE